MGIHMIRAAVKQALVKSWSYSRLDDYEKCPAYFRYKHIVKMPVPPAPAMERGNQMHSTLEHHVQAPAKYKIPKVLAGSMGKDMLGKLKDYRKRGATPERQLGFDRGWKVVPWNDWDNCWFRAKIDLSVRDESSLVTVDYKSGQMNHAKHRDQLELFALSALLAEPDAEYESSIGHAWYLDHGIIGPAVVVLNKDRAVPKLIKAWEKRSAPMFADRAFKETPGQQCNWCPFSGRRGGPCKKG
jgi:hypothetical protein